MTDKIFNQIYSSALSNDCPDRDAFISDWALSTVWGDHVDAEIPDSRLDQIGQIWDSAHIPLLELRHLFGLTQGDFYSRFAFPRRTWQNWESGVTACPPYIRLLLAHAAGLIDLNHFDG